MSKRLPPLNSLRVFEVAARRLSFTKAAEELHVTNAAVSHQIKLLEEHLGINLFNRSNNVLTLTEAGEMYLPRIRDGFRIFQAATDSLLNHRNTELKVGVSPTFGSKWLVPRLYRFLNAYPDIRIEVISDSQFNHHQCDISIDIQRVYLPEYRIEHFLTSELTPVCSPQLLDKLHSPADLSQVGLLHESRSLGDPNYPGWRQWYSTLGLPIKEAENGPSFSLSLMAIQAAIEGQGVALAQSILVEYDIAAGRLAPAFKISTPLSVDYFLMYSQDRAEDQAFQCFHAWLKREVQQSTRR